MTEAFGLEEELYGGSPPCINYQAGALTGVATNGKLRYNVNTISGWSGTLLYQEVKGKWKVVGMHTRGVYETAQPMDKSQGLSILHIAEQEGWQLGEEPLGEL
eukprot:TRINITY_DN67006_c13_g6_i2.p2 TRINITY_DN67006_c13_g6~~TRINITY_DN67006_c13_g6_i2.p2  ORF type:complete len:103 (+),score=13.18 TRINITY_DN67006_c13_g6_i2:713-1021(+)